MNSFGTAGSGKNIAGGLKISGMKNKTLNPEADTFALDQPTT
jgi:hypothetical protein